MMRLSLAKLSLLVLVGITLSHFGRVTNAMPVPPTAFSDLKSIGLVAREDIDLSNLGTDFYQGLLPCPDKPMIDPKFGPDLPTEIQLLVMSKLNLAELQNSKLISQRFKNLANVDQLWRRHTLQSGIEDGIMHEARVCCFGSIDDHHHHQDSPAKMAPTTTTPFSWQTLLRTATLIERENRRLIQGNLTQMTQKIHQVREALERQTRVLEETHQKLEMLSGRLTQMEQQSRVGELERIRIRRREEARLEDERWFREWDELCISHRLKDTTASGQDQQQSLVGCGEEQEWSVDDVDDEDLFIISSSFKKGSSIDGSSSGSSIDGSSSGSSSSNTSAAFSGKDVAVIKDETMAQCPEFLEEIQLPIGIASNGKERAERRGYLGL
ncbi:hypothetical protein BGX29_000241 [Mortierella sp. GBA35]|nr:hypothetical protein BGX29_000241 [Mortierella sp. GBA35]